MRVLEVGVGRTISPIARTPSAIAPLRLHGLAGVALLRPKIAGLAKTAVVVTEAVIVPGRRGVVGEGCYLSGWWDDGYGVLGGGVGSVVGRGGSTNPLLLSYTVAVIVVRSYQ